MKQRHLRLLCCLLYTGASRGSSAGGGQQQWGGHRDPVVSELLRLRHHMAHLVTNLQIYLQV
jgi:hypothetical protein